MAALPPNAFASARKKAWGLGTPMLLLCCCLGAESIGPAPSRPRRRPMKTMRFAESTSMVRAPLCARPWCFTVPGLAAGDLVLLDGKPRATRSERIGGTLKN